MRKGRHTMTLILLSLACVGTIDETVSDDGHNTDGVTDDTSTEVEMISADMASARTYAEIDGNVVNHWVEPTNQVAVEISGSTPTFTVDTIYTDEVARDSKATINHYEGDLHFVSETINVDDVDSDNPLHDCVDLKGSWVLKYDGYDTEYPFTIDSSECAPDTDMNDNVKIDGFYFTSEGFEGAISDGNTIKLVVKNDTSIHATATRK